MIKSSTAFALYKAGYNSAMRHKVVAKFKSLKFGSSRTKAIIVGRMLFKAGFRYNRRGRIYLKKRRSRVTRNLRYV